MSNKQNLKDPKPIFQMVYVLKIPTRGGGFPLLAHGLICVCEVYVFDVRPQQQNDDARADNSSLNIYVPVN